MKPQGTAKHIDNISDNQEILINLADHIASSADVEKARLAWRNTPIIKKVERETAYHVYVLEITMCMIRTFQGKDSEVA